MRLQTVLVSLLVLALAYGAWRVLFWLVPAPWATWVGVGAVVVNLALAIGFACRKGGK